MKFFLSCFENSFFNFRQRMNPFSVSYPPDRRKFIKIMQNKTKKTPIQKRGALYLPPVLIPYLTSPRKYKQAMLTSAGREISTAKCHNTTLCRIKEFLIQNNSDLDRMSQDDCLDYLWHCEEIGAPHSYVKNIKGAIRYILICNTFP